MKPYRRHKLSPRQFFSIENPKPTHFPLEARSLERLQFPNKEEEDKQVRKSAHSVNIGIKANTQQLQNHGNYFVYFFKNNDANLTPPESYISELEALCTAFYQFLAPKNVPSAHAYYHFVDTKFAFVGVASKGIPNFVSNYKSPLLKSDTKLTVMTEIIEAEAQVKCTELKIAIKNLIHSLDRSPGPSASYFYSGLQYTKNFCNFYCANTAVSLQNELTSFLQLKKITHKDLDSLLLKLLNRQRHIPATSKYQKERELLDHTITCLEEINLKVLDKIREFESFDQYQPPSDSLLNNEELLTQQIDEQVKKITAHDLKNYRILKRQATALVARYLMQDTDGHNQNMSKDGWIIDFDMAKLNIAFQFRNASERDKLLRRPDEKTFVVTTNDVRNFPDITDANYFYWVTKETILPESLIPSAPPWLYKIENFFRKIDNDVYKNLARNPIFLFFKWTAFLKYILCDGDIFRKIGELHLRADLFYKDEQDGRKKNLLDEIILDEQQRIKKLCEVLLNIPQFQNFMVRHGVYAFKLINEDITEFKNKMQKKDQKYGCSFHLTKTMNAAASCTNTLILSQTPCQLIQFNQIGDKKIIAEGKVLFDILVKLKCDHYLQTALKKKEYRSIKSELMSDQLIELNNLVLEKGDTPLISAYQSVIHTLDQKKLSNRFNDIYKVAQQNLMKKPKFKPSFVN